MRNDEFEALVEEVEKSVKRCIRREQVDGRRERRVQTTWGSLQSALEENLKKVDKKDVDMLQDVQQVYLKAFNRLVELGQRPGPVFLLAQKFGKGLVSLSKNQQSTGLTRSVLESFTAVSVPKGKVLPTLQTVNDMACLRDHRIIACGAVANIIQKDLKNPAVLDVALPILDRLGKGSIPKFAKDKIIELYALLAQNHPDRADLTEKLETVKNKNIAKNVSTRLWRSEKLM